MGQSGFVGLIKYNLEGIKELFSSLYSKSN